VEVRDTVIDYHEFELAGKWSDKSESDSRDERSEGKSYQRLAIVRSQSPIKSLLALFANLNALPHDAIWQIKCFRRKWTS
jgi:hypothetical protein